jgi:glycosyltransferase involved in cell wall biosynthesis
MRTILITSNTSWSIQNFRLGLIKELQKNFDVSFAAPFDDYTEKLKEDFKYHEVKINRKGKNPFQDLKLIFAFYNLAKKEKPDICHNFTIKPCIYGTLAQGFAGVKNIYCTITGLGATFEKRNMTNKIVILLYRFSLKGASKVIFQNPDDKKLFINLKIIEEKQATVIKSSGVDTAYFKREEKEGGSKIIISLISRMLYQKGIKEFIEASKILKEKHNNLEFLLIGPIDTENPSAIPRKKIKEWEDEGLIRYVPGVEDVKPLLLQTDIFTLPSFYREGVPKVLLEAGAMSLPLITTNTPGCKEVVDENKNGFFVKERDFKDLAEKMEILINNKDLREKFGKASREKIIKEFDEKIVINKYLEIINSSS